jgi:hypothetical protein
MIRAVLVSMWKHILAVTWEVVFFLPTGCVIAH